MRNGSVSGKQLTATEDVSVKVKQLKKGKKQ